MALPKVNRLTKKKDFDSVFRKGTAVNGNFLFIKYKKNSLVNFRLGFIIPVRVAKNIVSRNRLKRFLSELIRKNIKNNYDVIITLKEKQEENRLRLEILNLLNKANILNDKNSSQTN